VLHAKKFGGRARLHLSAAPVVLGLALLSNPAFAQTDPAIASDATVTPATTGSNVAAATADEPQTIVVTGSRIAQPNLTSASPVTVVAAQEIKLQGATRIEDVINNLPQSFAQQSSSVSNGSNGTATANLRNLGDQRTLVLVNGRRLMPGDPNSTSSAADLNVIPSALIKRVDVLTGGASSVYGSDAVGGVVNFVLDNEYEGVSIDSNYGLYNHKNRSSRFQQLSNNSNYPAPGGQSFDGRQFDVSLKMGVGTADGRGHLVGYVGYRKIAALIQGDRDYSSCGLNAPAGNAGPDYVCGGSATAFPANFSLNDSREGGPPVNYTLNANGQLVAGRSLYNANPLNYYQRPDKRYTAGFLASYEVSDAFKPYSEFMFMDDRTVAQIAPSGDFSNTDTINCNNPLLSAVQAATFCRASNLRTEIGPDGTRRVQTFLNPDGTPYNRGNVRVGRRNVEGGGRQADLSHTSYRIVAGAKGDVAPGVSYDVYGQYGTTKYNQVYRNEFSITKTARALDVIAGPGGVPTCRSVVDGSDPACIPLNIFGAAPITPAALAYVQQNGFQQGSTKEKIVSGSVTLLGDEYGVKSPWSDDGIGLNIGAEYREESLSLEVDQAFQSGDLAGQGGATLPVAGGYNVKEAFAELRVPIVTDRPFFHELSLEGGFRFSDYSLSGSVTSYKGLLTWAPVRDITLRGGYNRAVRAPNIQELFVSQSVQLDGATDPCAGSRADLTKAGLTPALCALTGLPASQFGLVSTNPSEQYNGLVGGNLNLDPEKADTYTAGLVLQPSFLPGFNATVDAFRIKVKGIIGTIGADTIISQCIATADPTLCGFINRDPNTNYTLWQGTGGYIVDTNVNAGTLTTQGIDVGANYTLRTDAAGTFSLAMSGTYVDKFTSNKAGANFDCAGLYGAQCGFPQSKWRHQARLSWTAANGIGVSGRWRYLSATKFERASDEADLAGSFYVLDRRIPSQSYFDLAVTARVADKVNFRIGANNILDKSPPILSQSASPISSFGNGNTYPGIYEANGRYMFVGVTVDM
jgi:iron complex outermembrane receptor protein